MNQELTNLVTSTGTYNNLPIVLTSQAATVLMVSSLTITKTADKSAWADGLLTYTITVNNSAATAYEKPIVTDILNGTLVDFVEDSVLINGTKATSEQYQYNSATHTLTINLTDIAPTQTSTIKFQVTKKA